jgi:Chaperone of endosialidase
MVFKLDKLKPVTYLNKLTNKRDVGLIAHELQELYPYLVEGEKDGEKYQSVNYIALIGILIKEIQEIKKKLNNINNLKSV